MGLKAHQIENALSRVVLAQLQNGVGLPAGFGVPEAHRLHGTIAQGIQPPAGHDLHRHTALEDPPVLEAVDLRLLGKNQLPDKGLVLLLVQGAVDIVRGAPVIAGLPPGKLHIHGLRRDQGGGGIEEMQIVRPEVFPNGF